MPEFQKDVTVNPESHYKLTIIVGQGQKGFSSFNKPDGSIHSLSSVQNEQMGSGQELLNAGSTMITTMATDVNPHTNLTSVIVKLNDETILHEEEEAPRRNGSVIYEITLNYQS